MIRLDLDQRYRVDVDIANKMPLLRYLLPHINHSININHNINLRQKSDNQVPKKPPCMSTPGLWATRMVSSKEL